MEARNITIVNSRTQQKNIVNTPAETLGELKAALREQGISYDGLSFYEGLSKTELKDDTAILPHDLPWKGTRTNNLVFMLTEPQKKIRNGAAVTSRAEAYKFIKDNELQAEVEKKFGNNFTRCKSPELIDFCNNYGKKASKAAAKPAAKTASKPAAKTASKPAKKEAVATSRRRPCKPECESTLKAEPATEAATVEVANQACDGNFVDHAGLVKLLVAKGVISANEAATGEVEAPTDVEFSKSDIDTMFKGVR